MDKDTLSTFFTTLILIFPLTLFIMLLVTIGASTFNEDIVETTSFYFGIFPIIHVGMTLLICDEIKQKFVSQQNINGHEKEK